MVRSLSVALITLLMLNVVVKGQEQASEEEDVRDGYIVEVIGGGGKVIETVGAYLTPEDADKAEKDWNARRPETLLLTRIREGKIVVKRQPVPKRRPGEQESRASGVRGSTINVPTPGFVDPGGIRNSASAPLLAGKKGTGKIGQYNVTIAFTGQGEKGEFIVTGDAVGKGKWTQLGPFVQMETGLAKLEGKLDGDKLSGTRTMKESGTKDEWSVTFKKADEVPLARPAADVKYNVVVRGTEEYLNTTTPYFTLDDALTAAREGWTVWRRREDMLGVSVVDSTGKTHLNLSK